MKPHIYCRSGLWFVRFGDFIDCSRHFEETCEAARSLFIGYRRRVLGLRE